MKFSQLAAKTMVAVQSTPDVTKGLCRTASARVQQFRDDVASEADAIREAKADA